MWIRRSSSQLEALALDDLVAALRSLDIRVADVQQGVQDEGARNLDAIVRLAIDERAFGLAVETKAYGTGSVARELTEDRRSLPRGTVPILVSEKITAEARKVLDEAGWSWFDRRGHIRLRAPGVRVNAGVPPETEGSTVRHTGAPLAGRAGISATSPPSRFASTAVWDAR